MPQAAAAEAQRKEALLSAQRVQAAIKEGEEKAEQVAVAAVVVIVVVVVHAWIHDALLAVV